MANILATNFQSIDQNLDGLLTNDELTAALGATYASGTLAALDSNGDGMIAISEVVNRSLGGFGGGFGATPGQKVTDIATQTAPLNDTNPSSTFRSIMIGVNDGVNTTLTQIGHVISQIGDFSGSATGNLIGVVTAMRQMMAQQNSAWGGSGYTVPGGSPQAAIQTFDQGGLLTGNRHAQGGVIVNAEGGEYIFSRNAVSRFGVGTLDAMNYGGAANDNGVVAAIRRMERSILIGIQALIQTELQTAGVIARPIEEANKLQRSRRGEKKKAA